MFVVQQRKMENTQNTIPWKQQDDAIQLVASGKPVPNATPRTKNPKRVAAGKKLAEHNKRKREEKQQQQQQQEENSISSQLSSIPNLVSVGTLLLAAYTVYSNRKPTQQQPYTNSNTTYANDNTAKQQQQQLDEPSKYM